MNFCTHFLCNSTLRKRSENDKASWCFLTITKAISDEIKVLASSQPRKGRGSVPVKARIGHITRSTSIFPDSKSGCYLLPVKKEIRRELRIQENDNVLVYLDILLSCNPQQQM